MGAFCSVEPIFIFETRSVRLFYFADAFCSGIGSLIDSNFLLYTGVFGMISEKALVFSGTGVFG